MSDVGRRLAAVTDALGIEHAHLAVGAGCDQAFDLMRERPDLAASITFLPAPNSVDIEVLRPRADRLVCISGEQLMPAQSRTLEAFHRLKGSKVTKLPGYAAALWSDIVRDNAELVLQALVAQAGAHDAPSVEVESSDGIMEEVRFRVEGTGPALLLFPIGLAPTQWDSILGDLKSRFTTVRLGGKQLGLVQTLEDRAANGTYIHGVRSMFEMLRIEASDRVLEVGAGTGALSRDLAARSYAPAQIVAVDINEFLLDEAKYLAQLVSPRSSIEFRVGNAESLPFEDESFDVAYCVTVLEECDADRGVAELHRVLRPGGRAGVIVRSSDLPRFWNVQASETIRSKLNAAYPETVAPAGCNDASLYERFARFFKDLQPNPFWRGMTDPPVGTVAQTMALLDAEEGAEFESALARGREQGTAFAASPFHCVVGRRA